MYGRILITFVVLAWTGQTAHATRVRMVKPADEPIFYDSEREPTAIKALAAAPGRVLATVEGWSGGDDFRTVYYHGDAAALNLFLERVASLPGLQGKDPPCVLIRDDAVEARQLLDEEYRVTTRDEYHGVVPEFDWALHVDSHGYGDKLGISVSVDVWLSDRIGLEDVKVPPRLRVKAVSRIEQFTDIHEANRLGSREAMLEQHIRALQQVLSRERLRQKSAAATQPAKMQRHSAGVPTTNPSP